jgi:hypothetical protein
MTDKKKYYKLDEIGILGKQEKNTPSYSRYHSRKTGEVFRQFREKNSFKSSHSKKAS